MLGSLKRLTKHFYYYLTADSFIAVYPDIKASQQKVNLFEYHPNRFYKDLLQNDLPYNLGDTLSFLVVDWMLQTKGLNKESNRKSKNGVKYVHLNSIGSNVFSSYQNATIWGSGAGAKNELNSRLNRLLNRHPYRKLDIRAVRGPLTREKLLQYGHKCPAIYGDPAILMPFIYSPEPVEEKYKKEILIIPQFLYEKEIREKYPDYAMESMNTDNYMQVIDQITSSKLVITSSLHAIILAEVYGVPAIFFKSLPKTFKFQDYYASTGRYDVKFANNLEEAFASTPPEIPDFTQLQKGLIESFPFDLWI